MELKWFILLITAFIPLLVGFIWYNPKVFGNAWLKSINMTEVQMKGANMIFIFGLTYLFGLMLSSGLMPIVIHQMGFYSTLANEAGIEDKSSEIAQYSKQFFETYGTRFRTFKHGLLHGILTSIMIALPVLGINALIERRGAKYIFIHLGYWAITCGLIGGIICQFA